MSIEISDWVEPIKSNPYTETITALIEAGSGKAVTILVPVADKLKTRTQFASAANDQERTARVRISEAHNDEWRYVFTLTTLNKPRRNKERERPSTPAGAR
jgi:3-methyladenine DNA glycosylase Mpg